jgi:glycosyltransferase involved in cell wall biosynthesis
MPGASGGIVPHMHGVLHALCRDHAGHEITLYCSPENAALADPVPPDVCRLILPPDRYYPMMDRLIGERRLDVLFCTYPRTERLRLPMCRQVVFIPDLQHEYFPEFFAPAVLKWRRAAYNRALRDAGAIGTNSEHARQAILTHRATRCPDVFLMNPALSAVAHAPSVADLTREERAALPAGPFFLYPANLWPHKNHRRVLEAFAGLRRRLPGEPIEFVFTGHPEGWTDLARPFAALPIRHLGFVRRAFLQVLLQRARALVFFSLFEGFGMPLLEAFDAGTPVLCSNTTSLPEVGGDAVLSCDPTDPDAMAALMARVLREPERCAPLRAHGAERLRCYSWEASAHELLDACWRVAERPVPMGVGPTILRLNDAVRRHAGAIYQRVRGRIKRQLRGTASSSRPTGAG